MVLNSQNAGLGTKRCPDAPSVQDYLDRDSRPVPEGLRWEEYTHLGSEDIDATRYTSREFHDLEMERMWTKVWQMACRLEEIPTVGDHVVYELGRFSIIVMRSAEDRVQAFHDVCLPRGRLLRDGGGWVPELRCQFHGFCWKNDGSLKSIPCAWDFEHIDRGDFNLPELRVDTWEGFVFVNMDPNCMPLEEYLGNIGGHFESVARPPLRDRTKTVHVTKTIRCNWKVALEAFLEAFHTVSTHPQSVLHSGDANTEYDVYAGQKHWNRMITPLAVPSPHLGPNVGEEDVFEAMVLDFMQDTKAAENTTIPEGGTARQAVADVVRGQYRRGFGYDTSQFSDSEMVDAIQYFVFPNLVPWPGIGVPVVYRFRPHGDDPDSCIMDFMLLHPMPDGTPAAPIRELGADDGWNEAPELGGGAAVFEQDTGNLPAVQRGLHATVKRGVTLGNYQEVRIRHLHQTLDEYVDA
jgi:phenylpropionate dioxygenase-like ring-hydroxylating dioxygenase large terminal subunit